jgi:menaquinone-dependent protoporphyrinogen oxidase
VSVLIAYATKYGTVERVAERIKERLSVPTELVNLKVTQSPDVESYDVVLLGGSIYAGRIRPQVTKFCERHHSALLTRKVGLFVSCLYDGEQGQHQIQENFPGWLLSHAYARYNVGGAVRFARLRLIDRVLMQRIANISEDFDHVNDEVIDRIVEDVHGLVAAGR